MSKEDLRERCLPEALARDGGNPVVLNNLALHLAKDPRKLDEAVALAERAYRAAHGNPAVADTLGWLLYQKGVLDRAEGLLAWAVKGVPDDPELRYHLGMVYAKRGKRQEARRELERALASPGFSGAAEVRRALDTVR